MTKQNIILTDAELEDCCNLHKEMMESFARHTHKYPAKKTFEIFSVAMAFTISLSLSSMGIKNINEYLNELMENIKAIHNDVNKNSCYMEYKNGVKISEGRFN